jgi:hypothetical protein
MYRKLFLALTVIAATLAFACAMGNIGSLKTSAEVSRKFESLQVNPNFRYWFLNQENNPFGVIGLDREFEFEGGPLWRAVEPDSATFKKVVGLVQSFPVAGASTTGFTIFDPAGRPIGVWYSSLNAGVTMNPATQRVSLATRTPWRTP